MANKKYGMFSPYNLAKASKVLGADLHGVGAIKTPNLEEGIKERTPMGTPLYEILTSKYKNGDLLVHTLFLSARTGESGSIDKLSHALTAYYRGENAITNMYAEIQKNGGDCSSLVEMFMDYNDLLTDMGILHPNTFNPNADIISVPTNTEDPFTDDDYAFMWKYKMFAIIPCLERAIIHIHDYASIYYEITKLDLDRMEMTLDVSLYSTLDYDGVRHCIPILHYTVSFEVNEDAELGSGSTRQFPFAIDVNIIGLPTLSSVYQKISPRSVWNSRDKAQLWNKTYLEYAKFVDETTTDRHPNSMTEGAICHTLSLICTLTKINRTLQENKASKVLAKKEAEAAGIHVGAFDPIAQETRKIHVINNMAFYTSKMPSMATSASVRKYKVASWQVRGHMRKTASGKECYIPPHPAHRRCIEGSENVKPGPKTLEINSK